MTGWIGVDLDGTLAIYEGWRGPEHIGEPIKPMVDRIKQWIRQGQKVKIFTARVSSNNPDREISREAIYKWCRNNLDCTLDVTAEKDYGMIELWDDRCKQVIQNTGIAIEDLTLDALLKKE